MILGTTDNSHTPSLFSVSGDGNIATNFLTKNIYLPFPTFYPAIVKSEHIQTYFSCVLRPVIADKSVVFHCTIHPTYKLNITRVGSITAVFQAVPGTRMGIISGMCCMPNELACVWKNTLESVTFKVLGWMVLQVPGFQIPTASSFCRKTQRPVTVQ